MNYEAILFDLDGVIIDTHQAVTEFWLRLAATHGVALTPADFQRDIYGCPADHTLEKLFPMLDAGDKAAVHASLETYELTATYREVPGAADFIRAINRQRVPAALVTSAFPWKTEIVKQQLGLNGLFSTQVTMADIQHGKPDPEGYLLAARRLQKPPQRCIVFEDSVSGVKAAVAAGTLCIGVRPVKIAPALIEVGACCTLPNFEAISVQPGQDGQTPLLTLQIEGGPLLRLSSG